jgi:hypothetical protein
MGVGWLGAIVMLAIIAGAGVGLAEGRPSRLKLLRGIAPIPLQQYSSSPRRGALAGPRAAAVAQASEAPGDGDGSSTSPSAGTSAPASTTAALAPASSATPSSGAPTATPASTAAPAVPSDGPASSSALPAAAAAADKDDSPAAAADDGPAPSAAASATPTTAATASASPSSPTPSKPSPPIVPLLGNPRPSPVSTTITGPANTFLTEQEIQNTLEKLGIRTNETTGIFPAPSEAPDNRTIRVVDFGGIPIASTDPADTSPRLLPELWVVLAAVLGSLYVLLLVGSFVGYRNVQARCNLDTKDIPEDAYFCKPTGRPAAAAQLLHQEVDAAGDEDLPVYSTPAAVSLGMATSHDGHLSQVLPTSTRTLDPPAEQEQVA